MAKLPSSDAPAPGSLAELVALEAPFRLEELQLFTRGKKGRHVTLSDKDFERFKNEASVKTTVAAQLPKAKRLSWDSSIFSLVGSTQSLDSEEIIGQLSHVSFPFDQFWLEWPGKQANGLRDGALITANQAKNEFSFIGLIETQISSWRDNLFPPAQQFYKHTNGRYTNSTAVPVRVSMDGIKLNEDKFLKHAEIIGASLIDVTYEMADFLTRAFVVLSSSNVPNNFQAPKTREEIDLEAKNRRRKEMGFAPILTLSPVKIDLAQINPRLFDAETVKEARQLLGWTSVRRSKLVTRPDGTLWLRKKDGKPWTRKPHDRQIAAPVDRRDAAREIFSSDPNLAIKIEADRPVRVRHDATLTGKPEPSK